MRFYIHTFGCQMNANDSEFIAGLLAERGAQPASIPEDGDVLIVNTCAVRKKSEDKLFSLLGRWGAIKRGRPSIIGVVGCIAQIYRRTLLERYPFIDFIVGTDNYHRLPDIFDRASEKTCLTARSRAWQETSVKRAHRASLYTAYLTIMEGCDNFCAYCVVPFTRGREKCRPLASILREAEDLGRQGYREIQLLGQNVNSYRDPQTGKGFVSLLKAVSQIEGIGWVRFLTSHPKNFSEEIARAMMEGDKICRQLHLPVQSGSTSVLARMNRGYTRQDYLKRIASLKKLMPDICLSTDIIVGFPCETEEEFRDTLSLLEAVRFTTIFSFRYSPRPHTAAARKLKDTVPLEVKKRRLIEVQDLQRKIQLEENRTFIGKVIEVLCLGRSKKDANIYSGRNEGYRVVNFHAPEDVLGRFIDVRITSCGPHSLRGTALL